MSFDTSGIVGDFFFADEDLFLFDGDSFVPGFDASTSDPDRVAAGLAVTTSFADGRRCSASIVRTGFVDSLRGTALDSR